MGTRLVEIPEDGDFDNFCWSTAAFFNPENPPKFLTIELSGLLKGDLWAPPDPEPPNGRFILTQANAIEWQLVSPEIIAAIAWSSISTDFIFFIVPLFFETTFNATSSTCQLLLPNVFATPTGRHFYSGTIQALEIS